MNRLENIETVIRELQAMNGTAVPVPESLADRQRLMRALMNIWQPQELSEAFLQAQDRELQAQREDKGEWLMANGESGISVVQADITRLQVDAIVNAANSQMLGCFQPLHACIDNTIHSAAGLQLRQECNEIMQGRELPTGEAVITRGYNLPAKHVIHTVGPIYGMQPKRVSEMALAACYRNCLNVAAEHGLTSIAFCCISTGVFGYPQDEAAEIAVHTVREWLSAHKEVEINVIFCTYKDEDYATYQRLTTGV
ncbi:MAG: protein-ADP-ribose hydrolase [Paludibacteraceae bacterium]|nr:protein-ADP-ribose hydrolase [Paludibacteraceae bacterium]